MRHGFLMLALGALSLGGCATYGGHEIVSAGDAASAPPHWEGLIKTADAARLGSLRQDWTRALDALPARLKAKAAQEGALLDPTAALDLPTLPPGPYYCRLVRLGGRAGLVSYKPDFCTVDGTVHSLAFTKQSGSTLPGGWLFADTDQRQVFLGTLRPSADRSAAAYGSDAARDVAGVVERVGPFRWRLVLTRAAMTTLDIYELVPVTPKVPGALPAVPG